MLKAKKKFKNNIYTAPKVSLDTEALGGVQTRAFEKYVSLNGA